MARIRHPHVIEIFDSGVHDGVPYLAMPLLDGVDLAAYLRAHGPLPLPQVIAILLPVLSAVAAAHAAGVVHRDLKPANALPSSRPGAGLHPIVLDFGISKPIDDGPVDLTLTTEVLGTAAHYMAPEQTRGSVVRRRAQRPGNSLAARSSTSARRASARSRARAPTS